MITTGKVTLAKVDASEAVRNPVKRNRTMLLRLGEVHVHGLTQARKNRACLGEAMRGFVDLMGIRGGRRCRTWSGRPSCIGPCMGW